MISITGRSRLKVKSCVLSLYAGQDYLFYPICLKKRPPLSLCVVYAYFVMVSHGYLLMTPAEIERCFRVMYFESA